MTSTYFGKKVKLDGYTFDSKQEARFYERFIKPSGKRFEVHPHYRVLDMCPIGGYRLRGRTYTPDFVVKDADGAIEHVYDVKAGFTQYSVSTAARIRFDLFARRYGMPVECVVVRAHDFRAKILGTTVKLDEYVRNNVNYDIAEIIGQ